MTTFTVQVEDNDAELIFKILQKFEAKIIEKKQSTVTNEIATALLEIKDIHSGKSKSFSLKDI